MYIYIYILYLDKLYIYIYIEHDQPVDGWEIWWSPPKRMLNLWKKKDELATPWTGVGKVPHLPIFNMFFGELSVVDIFWGMYTPEV